MVSYWPVVSDAAVAITTRMLAEAAKPGVGRAEAHRRAMMAMIDYKDRPHYAHPKRTARRGEIFANSRDSSSNAAMPLALSSAPGLPETVS